MSKFKALSPKRLSRMFFMWLAHTLPLRGNQRWRFVRLGGVDIKGKCYIYNDVHFDSVAPELITIGKNVTITAHSNILSHFLDPNQAGRHYRLGEVRIEDDVFIGVGTIICNSVTIGKGAIVGAGSVLTKDIPPYQWWAGNPARFIKERAH